MEDNFRHIFSLLTLICGYLLTLVSGCNIRSVETCPHSEYIRDDSEVFKAFIPADILDTRCRDLKEAIDCAFRDDIMKGCNIGQRQPYESQKTLYTAICDDYIYAYKMSVGCFFKDGVRSRVQSCIQALDDRKFCDSLEKARHCARNIVIQTEGCKQVDKSLMGKLVDLFLEHYSRHFSCQMTDIDEEPIPTEVQVSTITPNVTQQENGTVTEMAKTTTTTTTRSTTTEGGAQTLASSVFLLFLYAVVSLLALLQIA